MAILKTYMPACISFCLCKELCRVEQYAEVKAASKRAGGLPML